jgi:hypothetical protein
MKPELVGVEDPRLRADAARQVRGRSRDHLEASDDLEPTRVDRVRPVLASHRGRDHRVRGQHRVGHVVDQQDVRLVAEVLRLDRRLGLEDVPEDRRTAGRRPQGGSRAAGGHGRRDQGDDRAVDGLALRVDQLAQALLDRVHVAALDRLVGDERVLTGLDHAGQAGRAVTDGGHRVLGARGDGLGRLVREHALDGLVADSAASGVLAAGQEKRPDVALVAELWMRRATNAGLARNREAVRFGSDRVGAAGGYAVLISVTSRSQRPN